jgi:hypothetical protein
VTGIRRGGPNGSAPPPAAGYKPECCPHSGSLLAVAGRPRGPRARSTSHARPAPCPGGPQPRPRSPWLLGLLAICCLPGALALTAVVPTRWHL